MESRSSTLGVQQLIDRLRDEGVDEGRKRADALVDEARDRASSILREAQEEGDRIRRRAQDEADRLQKAAHAALQIAVRDATLKLKEEILDRLAHQLRQMVRHQLNNAEFLKEWLMELTREGLPKDSGPRRLLLPRDVAGVEDPRLGPEELEQDSLAAFASSLARDVLARGIEVAPGPDDQPGIRIDLVDQDVRIDLTHDAVSRLLLRHLTPRFRGLMEEILRNEASQ